MSPRRRFIDEFVVDRLLWLRASVFILLAGLGLVAVGYAESPTMDLGLPQILSLLLIAVASGWGVAYGVEHYRGRRAEQSDAMLSTTPLRYDLLSIVLVLGCALPLLLWLTNHVAASAFWMGQVETMLLLPAILATFVAVFVGTGLHRSAANFGALIVGLLLLAGGVPSGDDDGSNEQVSTATRAQLVHATDTGQPVLLRGADHAPAVRVEDDRPPKEPEVCQSITFTDRAFTRLGFRARTLDIDFDACWDGDGAPVSLTVAARRFQGTAGGTGYAVRLLPIDAFDRVALPPVRGASVDRPGDRQRLHYGDTRADFSTEPLKPESQPLKMRGADGLLRDDGDPDNDTVVARVDDDGVRVTAIVAIESADGVIARPGYRDERDRTYDRLAGAAPRPGRSLDVVTATIPRKGPAVAKLHRTTVGS